MRRARPVVLAMTLLTVILAAGTPAAAADRESSWVGPANNAFAADLYAKLIVEAKGNLFFSPNSIETALAMTYAGARGKTAEQMATVLHLPPKGEAIHQDLGAFTQGLNAEKTAEGKPRGYQLAVANALWGQKGERFLPAFLDLLKIHYGAGLSEVDFAGNTEGARQTINAWVEKETRDKIKELIKRGILGRDTVLVLTNAIYFKGDWAAKFKKEATKDAPFHLAADKTVDVPMMNRSGDYGYAEEEGFKALKLPYAGDELAMIILLPKKVDGLGTIEKSLTADNLGRWCSKFQTQKVKVSMPKFKTTAEFELAKTLADMGMPYAFHAADFSGMTGTKDLFISHVIHKAFADVNEEGTEAAAATAVIVPRNGGSHEMQVFRADHPFLFLIRHEASGAILFMGRMANPKG